MIKKTLLAAAACGMAIAGLALAGSPASADDDGPTVSIGDNACVAPWYWEGPLNVLTEDSSTDYNACNGNGSDSEEASALSVLDNACVAPWFWNGPGNAATSDLEADYNACKHNG